MVKILVAGDVEGHLDELFVKVKQLNKLKSGPFDLLVCVGAFSAADREEELARYLTADAECTPIPTYFYEAGKSASLQAALKEHQSEVQELAPSLFYLGSCGIKSVGKLTIAYLSRSHSAHDLEIVRQIGGMGGYGGADLLLTSDWPRGFDSDLPNAACEQLQTLGVHLSTAGDAAAADIAVITRPRYHFAAGQGVYYQRLPYRNSSNSSAQTSTKGRTHVTRLIGIGSCAAANGGAAVDKTAKWLHAISAEPIAYMTKEALAEEPVGTTGNPYVAAVGFKAGGKRAIGSTVIHDNDDSSKRARHHNDAAADDSNNDDTADLQKSVAVPAWAQRIGQEEDKVTLLYHYCIIITVILSHCIV
jgi:hypothetical protein